MCIRDRVSTQSTWGQFIGLQMRIAVLLALALTFTISLAAAPNPYVSKVLNILSKDFKGELALRTKVGNSSLEQCAQALVNEGEGLLQAFLAFNSDDLVKGLVEALLAAPQLWTYCGQAFQERIQERYLSVENKTEAAELAVEDMWLNLHALFISDTGIEGGDAIFKDYVAVYFLTTSGVGPFDFVTPSMKAFEQTSTDPTCPTLARVVTNAVQRVINQRGDLSTLILAIFEIGPQIHGFLRVCLDFQTISINRHTDIFDFSLGLQEFVSFMLSHALRLQARKDNFTSK
eukprot:TRINITY_DN23200_c0_g1_i1.p1 TRINITY_DN23200_c0_g1~~TRINITY_DN23200_c0_g1_i1.p1  ORF type:complete len:289 (-),score=92.66 TRINITY_DN23200_c0_g1_i1:221-1087(-)